MEWGGGFGRVYGWRKRRLQESPGVEKRRKGKDLSECSMEHGEVKGQEKVGREGEEVVCRE